MILDIGMKILGNSRFMNNVVDVVNTLSDAQKNEISDKIELLISHYKRNFDCRMNPYFGGVIDGMNHIYKLINEIDDDYNSAD